jgi:signal transduction histidine kinase
MGSTSISDPRIDPDRAARSRALPERDRANFPTFQGPLPIVAVLRLNGEMLRNSTLKLRLTLRIVGAAALCFTAIAAYVLIDTDRSMRRRIDTVARITAKELELQQNKLEWMKTPVSTFPELQTVASQLLAPGLCLAYRKPDGELQQRLCMGDQEAEPPSVFASLYGGLFGPGLERAAAVTFQGRKLGEAVAWGDPAALTAQAWQAVNHLLAAMIVTLLLLSVLVYAALAQALRPLQAIRAGIERIAANDLSARLPAFDLAELSDVGTVFNRLADGLETALAERTELSQRLIALRDDERRHLARELHDEFGQNLAAIRALAAAGGTAECASIGRTASEMMETLRGTLFRLRPPDVDELGLAASLEGLVDGWNGRSRGRTRFEIRLGRGLDALPASVGGSLYRIAQEALTNAAKHAGATCVTLALTLREGEVELTVADDGRSGDAEPAGRRGLGLLGMRERVDSLGGRMRFDGGRGTGANLRVVIPVDRAA